MRRVFNIRTVQKTYQRLAASTLTEYAVILALVSISAVAILLSIGKQTNNLLDSMNSNFPK